MTHELKNEQTYLDKVNQTINSEITKFEQETDRRFQEAEYIRQNFWNEIKINTDTFDDFLETVIGLRQEAQVLAVSQSTHRHATERLTALRRMKETPYFGRMDFTEEGSKDSEKIYIGITSLTDETGFDFYVYDWRAPISSVYYDYAPGPAEYQTPGGLVRGEMASKWQYLIKNGQIESMFDTSLTIGDEVLQHVLGGGTNKHMRSIVASIQREQNQIIRHNEGRLLVVQGAAGSGKTSAALQRVAYLLYHFKGHLQADQIVLFSPNALFNDYVSQVLPELGEANMQQATFQEYLIHRLAGGKFKLEDNYKQLEYVLTGTNDADYASRIANIRLKSSLQFFTMMNTFCQSLEQSGMIFRGVKFRGAWIATAEEITERFYTEKVSKKFHLRVEKIQEWLLEQIGNLEKAELHKDWVQEEIELLSKDDYQKVHERLEKEAADLFDGEDLEHEFLCKMVVKRKLKPLRNWVKQLGFVDVSGTYTRLFTEFDVTGCLERDALTSWSAICDLTMKRMQEGKLYYEDATPYLYFNEFIQGFSANMSVKQVLIDEAQDYTPFQFEFLKRLFPTARMTVLGDFNQAIFSHANEMVDFQMLKGLYGPEQTSEITLSRSYRSTMPIVEFTRALVPEGDKIIPFNRDGEKPTLIQVSNHEELLSSVVAKINTFKESLYPTIAIICKSAAESEKAYEDLKGRIDDLRLVTTGSKEYEQGIVVIPVYLAKGIEFDAVIIFDASAENYCDESLRRLFYTACTRAMHELCLFSVGEKSPFVQKIDSNLFVNHKN